MPNPPPLATVDQAALEQALASWVQATIAAQIWKDENQGRPDYPFAAVRFNTVIPYETAATPEVREIYDTTQAAGSEMFLAQVQPVVYQFEVEVFAQPTSGDACAFALANKLRASATTAAADALFTAANAAVVGINPVLNVSAVVEANFESRAIVTILLDTIDGAFDQTGYIANMPFVPGVNLITSQ